MRILVGEDERINQLYLRHLLSGAGFEPVLVADGQAALDELAARRYDLVLLDIHMPQVDGLEVARRVRGGVGETAADVPIVAMTALVQDDDRERLLGAGFSEVLGKPFSDERLIELAQSLTSQQGA